VLEPVGRIARGLRLIGEGASRASRSLDGFRVVQFIHFCCDDDSARARSHLKPVLARSLSGEVRLLQEGKLELGRRDYLAAVSPGEYEVTLRRLAEGGDPREAIPDALVAELAISGTAQECAEALRRYADVGVREFAFVMPEGAIETGIRTIGQEVAPLLQLGAGAAGHHVPTSPGWASGPGHGEGSSVRQS
jgi:alkanesulfonate monooxygenase SsuD/methylene tetrahydromethanopterin reductase-like flavin-dependent oxidoreductase (luciferase family)